MAAEIRSITNDLFPHAEIPDYVKSEALSVAQKVIKKQSELTNQITFLSMSDTSFTVNVVDLDEKVVYSYCYGAGIDRVVNCGQTIYHSITNNLTNITTSNSAASVEDGSSYSAILTVQSGYSFSEATVTMGGTDITSTAWHAATKEVSIPKVTGNVVITAIANKLITYTNQVTISTDSNGNVYNQTGYKDGYRISSSGGEAALTGYACTGFIPFTKGQTIRLGGDGITFADYGCMMMFYDENKKYLANSGIDYAKVGKETYGAWTDENNSVFCLKAESTYPTAMGTKGYIRISAKGTGANMIVTLDEEIK